MTRTRRFVGGISVGFTYQAVVTLVGLWLTPFLLSRLGAHEYGLWLTAIQLIAYLGLIDFGVLAVLPRDAAYATGMAAGDANAAQVQEVVGRTARLVVWQMPLIAVAAWIAWYLLPESSQPLHVPLAIVLATFVVTYPLRIFQGALQGLQDLAFVGAWQFAAWGLGTAITIYLAWSGRGLSALAAGAAAMQVLALGACAYRVATRFPSAWPSRLPQMSWSAAQPHIARALWVSLGQTAHVLLYATDALIVAWIFGPVAVVPYACTQKLIFVLSNQPQMLTQVAAPALSELRMGASRHQLFSVTSSLSLALMLASGAALVVVLAVNRVFVSWWVGPDLYGGTLLTALFGAAMLVRHWNAALMSTLFSFGRERLISLTMAADGIVTVILSLVLGTTIGVLGVPLGFLAGAALVSLPVNVRALARETGASPIQLVSTLAPWAVRVLLLLPLAFAAGLVRSASLWSVLVITGGMSVAYAALMFPLVLRPPLGDYVRRGFAPVFAFVASRKPVAAAAAGSSDA